MIDNILIYECGSMTSFYEINRYEDAIKWREYVKDYFKESNIKVFDPTFNSLNHFKHPREYYDGIIKQNHIYLNKSHILLVNLDMFEDSIGSIWEMSTMYNEHKPIICFNECKKWEQRPHLKSMVSVKLDTVEDACDYILSMYGQKI